jgi:prepilin-type N-terminal cleavage/methylation domain-containing protein
VHRRDDAAARGLTLIELLVVMAILVILVGMGYAILRPTFRPPPEASDIANIGGALERYRYELGSYPHDTGFGLKPDAGSPLYDPGSLWRYLTRAVVDPKTAQVRGPYLEWPQDRTKSYDDPLRGRSSLLIDPWGNPFGYVADPRRTLHNIGGFDLFSPGRDGETACGAAEQDPNDTAPGANRAYNGKDDDGNGVVDDRDELGDATGNGEGPDDSNNWAGR